MRGNPFQRARQILRNEGLVSFLGSSTSFLLYKSLGRDLFVRYNSYKNYIVNSYRYSAVAHPYKTITIDPNDVDHLVRVRINLGLGQIEGGDWDLHDNRIPIQHNWIVRGIEERYARGMNWQDTVYITEAKKRFSQGDGKRWMGCSNVKEFIEKRCSYNDKLFEDIAKNGYKPNSIDVENTNAKYPKEFQNLEPFVAISRDGEIFKTSEGVHRFAIAKVLNLEIPVHVLRRHEKWQILRDQLSESDAAPSQFEDPEQLTHPDMVGVLSST